MQKDLARRQRADGQVVQHNDDARAKFPVVSILPPPINLLPKSLPVRRRRRVRPVRREGRPLDPVEEDERSPRVRYVHIRPRARRVQVRREADEQARGEEERNVEAPRRRRRQPLYAHVRRLRAVASLHCREGGQATGEATTRASAAGRRPSDRPQRQECTGT